MSDSIDMFKNGKYRQQMFLLRKQENTCVINITNSSAPPSVAVSRLSSSLFINVSCDIK